MSFSIRLIKLSMSEMLRSFASSIQVFRPCGFLLNKVSLNFSRIVKMLDKVGYSLITLFSISGESFLTLFIGLHESFIRYLRSINLYLSLSDLRISCISRLFLMVYMRITDAEPVYPLAFKDSSMFLKVCHFTINSSITL